MKITTAQDQFTIYCTQTRKMSMNTLKSYGHAVRRFSTYMQREMKIDVIGDVEKAHILAYQQELNTSYAPATAIQHYTIIHVFFDFLEDFGIIEDTPFRKIHRRNVKIPKRIPISLTIEEIKKLLTAAYLTPPDMYYESTTCMEMLHYRDCLILEILFNTGMRIQELCNLKISDYDLETGIIQFIGKGNKERKCYITAKHIPELYLNYLTLREAYLRKCGNNFSSIMINRFGNPLSDQGARNIVIKYSQLADIKKHVTPHVIRRSFASLLLEKNVNLRYIQEYMGHETILTTQRYLCINDDKAKKTLEKYHPRNTIEPEMFDIFNK